MTDHEPPPPHCAKNDRQPAADDGKRDGFEPSMDTRPGFGAGLPPMPPRDQGGLANATALDLSAQNTLVDQKAKALPPIMTVDELATYLRVNRKTVYAAVAAGELPGARRIGGTIRIDRDTVLLWLSGEGRAPSSRSNPR